MCRAHITEILHEVSSPDTAVILSDGSAALYLSDAGSQCPLSGATHAQQLLPPGGGAVCGAISARAQKLAIGCEDGIARLWTLGGGAAEGCQMFSLADWGHTVETTGSVQCIVWSPDSEVCFLYRIWYSLIEHFLDYSISF